MISSAFIIITGASRGIGRALLEIMARPGTRLLCISRNSDSKLMDSLESRAEKIDWLELDLSRPLEAEKVLEPFFLEAAEAAYLRYALVNNAGMLKPVSPVGGAAASDIAESLSLNTVAPLILMNLFMKHFGKLSADRRILNVSSGAGRNAYPGWAAYCSSKAALDMASLTLAAEQKGRKNPVRVAAFAPGVVDTDMQSRLRSCSSSEFPGVERFISMKNDGYLLEPSVPAAAIQRLLEGEEFPEEVILDIREMKGSLE